VAAAAVAVIALPSNNGTHGSYSPRRTRGVDYGLGKLIDIYRPQRPAGIPVVLLWHGAGPDERDVLETLARASAEPGVMVCVPDWRPDAPDNGRRHLLASIGFTRERAAGLGGDPARIVLAGWSRGGRAAAGVALNPSVTAAGSHRPSHASDPASVRRPR
jgi:acetyl esterase/lipase